MGDANVIKVRWTGFGQNDPDADEAAFRLEKEGGTATVETPEGQGFAFIPIVVAAIAVVGLAKAIKSFVDDIGKGVMIDVRANPVKISKEESLPRGVVVLIDKDGGVSIHQPDHENLADLIKAAQAAQGS